MAGLTLEKVIDLLGVETIPAEPPHTQRLVRWLERILESQGEAYLRQNRAEILNQWEQYMQKKYRSCC